MYAPEIPDNVEPTQFDPFLPVPKRAKSVLPSQASRALISKHNTVLRKMSQLHDDPAWPVDEVCLIIKSKKGNLVYTSDEGRLPEDVVKDIDSSKTMFLTPKTVSISFSFSFVF